MDADRYTRFEREIAVWAKQHPDVTGLVAVGAGARQSHSPDEWSDHDLWVIALPRRAEGLRDGSWVPDPDRVALRYRESRHGTNVIYEDGHLVEFAVFEPEELVEARVNDYRVLLGGDALEGRLEGIAAATTAEGHDRANDGALFGRFVGRLVIGVSRFGRGEYLSADVMVRSGALDALLHMAVNSIPPADTILLDNLDRSRRFERTHPALAMRLRDALSLPLLDTANELLTIADEALSERAPGFSADAITATRRLISRASAADR